MPNAAREPFIKPFEPDLTELPRSLNTGFQIAGNAMALRDRQRAEQERIATENAISANPPQGMTGAPAELADQGMGIQALKVQEMLSKMSDEELKRTEHQQEKLKPIVFSAYSRYEDILAQTGDPAKANEIMQQYWPEYQQAWVKAGGKESDLSPTYSHADTMQWLTVDDMLKKKLYSVREKAITTKAAGGGRGGNPTTFIQLSNHFKKQMIADSKTGKQRRRTDAEADQKAKETMQIGKTKSEEDLIVMFTKDFGEEEARLMARRIKGGGAQTPAAGQRTGRSAKDASGNIFYESSDGSWKDAQGNPYKGK